MPELTPRTCATRCEISSKSRRASGVPTSESKTATTSDLLTNSPAPITETSPLRRLKTLEKKTSHAPVSTAARITTPIKYFRSSRRRCSRAFSANRSEERTTRCAVGSLGGLPARAVEIAAGIVLISDGASCFEPLGTTDAARPGASGRGLRRLWLESGCGLRPLWLSDRAGPGRCLARRVGLGGFLTYTPAATL